MENYIRLQEQERMIVEKGLIEGRSINEIARSIDRWPSSISREIKRNGGKLKYYARKAQNERTASNRKGYSKIDEILGLAEYIRKKLDEGWSPTVIAGRWKLDNQIKISAEAIYSWIYNQEDDLYLKLPRKKKKRGLKVRQSKQVIIKDKVSIHERPDFINERSEIGHCEVDLMFQQGNQSQNILTVIERKTRMVMLVKNKSKHSDVVIEALASAKATQKFPIKTATFDNGSEFASHRKLDIDTYFCDPGSPWQKGAVENVNGILRRHLDYRIDANEITQSMLDQIANKLNSKPRKILNFLTPREAMEKLYIQKLEGVALNS